MTSSITLAHRRDLGQRVGVGPSTMHQQISVDDLLQGGAERLDQLGRQVPREADGVGQHERPAVVEFTAAGGGLQGGEQRVLHQHPRAPVSALSRLDFPALV